MSALSAAASSPAQHTSMDLALQLSTLLLKLSLGTPFGEDVLAVAGELIHEAHHTALPTAAKPALQRSLAQAIPQVEALCEVFAVQMRAVLEDAGAAELSRGRPAGGSGSTGPERGAALAARVEAIALRFHDMCLVLLASHQLCRRCDLADVDAAAVRAFQVSVGLVLGCGALLLDAIAEGRLLSGPGSGGQRATGSAAHAETGSLAERCLQAQVQLMVSVCSTPTPATPPPFKPARVHSWLAAACEAMWVLYQPALSRGRPPPLHCLVGVSRTLVFVLHMGGPALNPHLLDLVVALFLPGLRAMAVALALSDEQRSEWRDWHAAEVLLMVLGSSELMPALARHVLDVAGSSGGQGRVSRSGSGGSMSAAAPRLVGCLVKLMEAAAAGYAQSCRAGTPSDDVGTVATYSTWVLGTVCAKLLCVVHSTPAPGSQHWQDQQRAVAHVLQGVQQMPLVLDIAAAGDPQGLGSGASGSAAARTCDSWRQVLLWLTEAARAARTTSHHPVVPIAGFPRWCAASTAALRALPALVELHRLQGVPAGRAPARGHATLAPSDLCAAVLEMAEGAARAMETSSLGGPGGMARAEPEAAAAAQVAAWGLHSTLCRCAHRLAGEGLLALPAWRGPALDLIRALWSTYGAYLLVGLLDCPAQPITQRQAVLAASWGAVLALAAGREAEGAADEALATCMAGFAADSASNGLGALLASEPVAQLLAQVFKRIPKSHNGRARFAISILTARQQTRVTASQLRHDVLWQLAEARQTGEPGGHILPALRALVSEAELVCAQPRLQLGGATTEVEAEAWRQRLGQAAAALQLALRQHSAARSVAALKRDLQQPAEQLAGLMQQWWQRPEQVAGDELEMAQAAVVRSCAYLRCANLAFEGGPAGQPGCGAQRCGKCRAAYYCGTACSHADWRAGHRRVCAELAAIRQQERAQQGQQA